MVTTNLWNLLLFYATIPETWYRRLSNDCITTNKGTPSIVTPLFGSYFAVSQTVHRFLAKRDFLFHFLHCRFIISWGTAFLCHPRWLSWHGVCLYQLAVFRSVPNFFLFKITTYIMVMKDIILSLLLVLAFIYLFSSIIHILKRQQRSCVLNINFSTTFNQCDGHKGFGTMPVGNATGRTSEMSLLMSKYRILAGCCSRSFQFFFSREWNLIYIALLSVSKHTMHILSAQLNIFL